MTSVGAGRAARPGQHDHRGRAAVGGRRQETGRVVAEARGAGPGRPHGRRHAASGVQAHEGGLGPLDTRACGCDGVCPPRGRGGRSRAGGGGARGGGQGHFRFFGQAKGYGRGEKGGVGAACAGVGGAEQKSGQDSAGGAAGQPSILPGCGPSPLSSGPAGGDVPHPCTTRIHAREAPLGA